MLILATLFGPEKSFECNLNESIDNGFETSYFQVNIVRLRKYAQMALFLHRKIRRITWYHGYLFIESIKNMQKGSNARDLYSHQTPQARVKTSPLPPGQPTNLRRPPPNQKSYSGPGKLERKWVKYKFSIEIVVCKFQNFLKNFKSWFVFCQNEQRFVARVLNFFSNY